MNSIHTRFLGDETQKCVRTIFENRYQISSDAIVEFVADCRDHESQLTVETLLAYVATLNCKSYEEFAMQFRTMIG